MILSVDSDVFKILLRSFQVALSALSLSILFGIPAGVWLAFSRFRGRRLLTGIIYTSMGLPPVVIGLLVYLFLSRSGPLGELEWLFSIKAIIVAQTILATPVIIGVTMSSLLSLDPSLPIQLRALGATHRQVVLTLLNEARFGIILGIVAGFGRVISEVGAVMLVGGNIEGRTRVLTTAIILETRRGNFDFALALGIVLLSLAFITNLVMMMGQGRYTNTY